MKKLVLVFLLAVGVAAAADSWRVNIPSVLYVGTTELKPGDYKVAIEDGKASFKKGKEVIEVPAKMEEGEKKNSDTALGVSMTNGKRTLVDIRLGGSKSKIVFTGASMISE